MTKPKTTITMFSSCLNMVGIVFLYKVLLELNYGLNFTAICSSVAFLTLSLILFCMNISSRFFSPHFWLLEDFSQTFYSLMSLPIFHPQKSLLETIHPIFSLFKPLPKLSLNVMCLVDFSFKFLSCLEVLNSKLLETKIKIKKILWFVLISTFPR